MTELNYKIKLIIIFQVIYVYEQILKIVEDYKIILLKEWYQKDYLIELKSDILIFFVNYFYKK